MALGDRKYSSAPWVPTMVNYPGATFGDFAERILKQCYFHSQHHARYLWHTDYGMDLRDSVTDAASVKRSILNTTYVPVGSGRRDVPRETTHLRAWFGFAIQAEYRVDVHMRLTVTDGVTPDTQARTIDADTFSTTSFVGTETSAFYHPNRDPVVIFLESIDVALVNAGGGPGSPGRLQSYLEAYATKPDQGNAQAYLVPIWVSCFAELRL